MFAPFVIGIVLTLCTLGLARAAGMDTDKGVWATTLIAIALFYVVFAVENGTHGDIAVHAALASVFCTLAWWGYRNGLLWIAGGLALHGIMDILISGRTYDPSPDWWGSFCLGVDITLALAVLALWRGTRSSA